MSVQRGILVAVTPNPSVDRVWHIPGFRAGGDFRIERVWAGAGGKGCNVARVAAGLKAGRNACADIVATGFLAGAAGDFIEADLRRHGVRPAFLRLCSGETRTCPTIVDPLSGEVTQVREPGPTLTAGDARAFEEHFVSLLSSLQGTEPAPVVVTLSGSLPPGLPEDFYARLIKAAARLGVPCVLDASGRPLLLGVQAGPWAVKINQGELLGLMEMIGVGEREGTGAEPSRQSEPSRPSEPCRHPEPSQSSEPYRHPEPSERSEPSEQTLLGGLAALIRSGVTFAVVTRGRRGLLACDGRTFWRALPPPDLEMIQPVGSGDAATAALGFDLLCLVVNGSLSTRAGSWPNLGFPGLPGPDQADLVRDMVAAGAANAVTEGIGTCPPEVFAAMLRRVPPVETWGPLLGTSP